MKKKEKKDGFQNLQVQCGQRTFSISCPSGIGPSDVALQLKFRPIMYLQTVDIPIIQH